MRCARRQVGSIAQGFSMAYETRPFWIRRAYCIPRASALLLSSLSLRQYKDKLLEFVNTPKLLLRLVRNKQSNERLFIILTV